MSKTPKRGKFIDTPRTKLATVVRNEKARKRVLKNAVAPYDPADNPEPFLDKKTGEYLTPLQQAYQHLPGGWTSWLRYVKIAKMNGDPNLKLLYKYITNELEQGRLTEAELRNIPPEDMCQRANVSIMEVVGGLQKWIWVYAKTEAANIAAAFNPAIIAKLATSALGSGRNAAKDRELFLKIVGDLPVPTGSKILIQNANVGSTEAARLPSAAQDQRALEALDEIMDITPSR